MSSDIKPGILLSVFLCSLIALVLRIHSRRRRGGKGGRAAPPPTPSWQVVALVTLTLDSQSLGRLQEGKESWSGRHLSPSSFHLLDHFNLHLLDLLLLSFLPLTLAFLRTQDMEHQH